MVAFEENACSVPPSKVLNGWADLDNPDKGVTLWAGEVQSEVTKDEEGRMGV